MMAMSEYLTSDLQLAARAASPLPTPTVSTWRIDTGVGCGSPPPCTSNPLPALRQMQLDIAAFQKPRSGVPIGEADPEAVIATGFTIVSDLDLVGEATLAVDLGRSPNDPPRRIDNNVLRHAGSLHLQTAPMVD